MANAIKVDEIEITPQMIEAGVQELRELAIASPPAEVAERLYLAMEIERRAMRDLPSLR